MISESDKLIETHDSFVELIGSAVKISDYCLGVEHTGRQNRALFTFSKLLAHSMTLAGLCDTQSISEDSEVLLDHFSIATITRATVDASVMVLYVSEPSLTFPQWDLRRQVLFLHDLSNRKRFLSAALKAHPSQEKPPFFENYESVKSSICKKIENRCGELGLNERMAELLKGQTVYIDGVRGAIREAGLDVHEYDFLQAYLSNHEHTHPGSFLRAIEHEISFDKPSSFQLSFSSLCYSSAQEILEVVVDRMSSFVGDIKKDPIGHLD